VAVAPRKQAAFPCRVRGGDGMLLRVHYNNCSEAAQTPSSGFQIKC
jgi:hypothetical protein